MCQIEQRDGIASFAALFHVLCELFEKSMRGVRYRSPPRHLYGRGLCILLATVLAHHHANMGSPLLHWSTHMSEVSFISSWWTDRYGRAIFQPQPALQRVKCVCCDTIVTATERAKIDGPTLDRVWACILQLFHCICDRFLPIGVLSVFARIETW